MERIKRYFNTEGICRPGYHYMVNIDNRLKQIKESFVDRGKYFVINRGRQYGKTTMLQLLADDLKDEYIVVFMDFQEISSADFQNEEAFSKVFAKIYVRACREQQTDGVEMLTEPLCHFIEKEKCAALQELFVKLSKGCGDSWKKIVLIIDEIDSAGNNQVFLDFLAMLRTYYLNREHKPIFQSVILAGVYDIKNLKLKIRPDEQHQYNSPWNIAADFDMDMSFSPQQISGMLQDYEADYHTGMDIGEMAEEIYQYTSGYPYLVSAICRFLDEKEAVLVMHKDAKEKSGPAAGRGAEEVQINSGMESAWTKHGAAWAVKMLLEERRPIFESMTRQLAEYPDMKRMLHAILFQGKRITYNPYNPVIHLASMFGYIVRKDSAVQIANRVFEICLYNFFLSEEELSNVLYDEAQGSRKEFIRGGKLDMELILERFVISFQEIYGDNDGRFIEKYGRKFFLLYLKPVINGIGNYYIEAQTRDARRTDVIVDYLGEQYIIEMKIWRGREYQERGEKQLAEYLEYYRKDKGYMVSFCFNKNKQTGVRKIQAGGKVIIEAVV